MSSPRWRKLLRDLSMEKGRALLMVTGVAVSLIGVGTMLGAYAILTREMSRNYAATHPASATLELAGAVSPALVAEVRLRPEIADAEARATVLARAKVGDDWRPLLLFVIDDFASLRLNTFQPVSGAWPPPLGTMLIERTAVPMLAAQAGDQVMVKAPHGRAQLVRVTGLVHDAGLAPAWQEREGYGYITAATLGLLGEPAVLDELRITVRDEPLTSGAVEITAGELAGWLKTRGHPVREIRVPPPGRHPHQFQMTAILLLLLAFSTMALILSAILVATSLASMLARQVREIGVMKTVGARSGQIVVLYVVFVALMGIAATAAAVPAAMVVARIFSAQVGALLNFTIASQAIPWWAFAIQAAAGVLVPVMVAAVPIAQAARTTVREAIDQYGVGGDALHRRRVSRLARLPWMSRAAVLATRNAFRRRTRLALTLTLLAAGGSMFMTALNVSRAWERNIAKVYETRHYDVEVRLNEPQPAALADRLRRIPGVRVVEPWGDDRTAFSESGRVDLVRTYPDRSHGSLSLLAPPPETDLVRFPMLAGRWLVPGDTDAVVLNQMALGQAPATRVGDRIELSLAARTTPWRVVGVAEEIGSPGAAYVTDEAFSRAAGTGGGIRMLRIATGTSSPERRTAVIRRIEDALEREGVSVEAAIPLAELRTAVGDHIVILTRALFAMAFVMATVGALGLASTMGTSVLERTRELGVMKAIGATPGLIARIVVGEALLVSALSWIVAVALAVPLTALLRKVVGTLAFRSPLPPVMSLHGVFLWLALVLLVSVAATLLPARRAARLTVREALAHA